MRNPIEFKQGVQLLQNDTQFYALMFAAILKADSKNTLRLKNAYPELWQETWKRWDSPGGLLDHERAVMELARDG